MNIIDSYKLFYSEYLSINRNKIIIVLILLIYIYISISQTILLPSFVNLLVSQNKKKKYIYLIFLTLFFISIFYYIGNKLLHRVIWEMNSLSRIKFFEAIFNKFSESFEEIEVSRYLNRIFSSTLEFLRFNKSVAYNIVPTLLIIIGSMIYFLFIDKISSFIILSCLILFYIIYCIQGTKVKEGIVKAELNFYQMYENIQNQYSNLFNSIINNQLTQDTKKMIREQYTFKSFIDDSEKKMNSFLFILYLISSFFIFILCVNVFVFNKSKKSNQLLKTILVFIFIGSILSLVGFIKESIAFISTVQGSQQFLLDLVNQKSINKREKILNGSLEITNLYFSYKNNYIISKLNLKICDKEKIALLGKSGSGKSTLVKLILKLYKYRGVIKVGNINIQNISTMDLRNKITYINQRTNLLNKSIIENIKYGNEKSVEYIISFLKKYQLYTIFDNLENNIYEICKTNGNNLSLGMQKIIILVRGILNTNNSYIIILDEPLAGLDQISRKKVLKMINKECFNKTLLIITHDMEVKSIVNRVINLNEINNL